MGVRRSRAEIIEIGAVLLSLGLFASVASQQLRWIGQLSSAGLQRTKTSLRLALREIRNDLNRELTRAYLSFHFAPGSDPDAWARITAEGYASWHQTARFPSLVRRIWVVGHPRTADGPAISEYNMEAKRYVSVEWPPELARLREQLTWPFPGAKGFGARTFTGVAQPDAPILVFAVLPAIGSRFSDATAWMVIELDQRYLLTTVLPQIIRQHIDDADHYDYQVAVSASRGNLIYRSSQAPAFVNMDATCSLLEIGREFVPPDADNSRPVSWLRARVAMPGQPDAPPDEGGVWQLQLRHRAGSLEAAASGLYRSNVLLSAAMMALVAGDLAILALLMYRARRLGEMKTEFAAGVSHDLRTPLAAISCAADNLSAGIAQDPSRVRQYGTQIFHEAQRLSNLVEQILTFTSGRLEKGVSKLGVVDAGQVIRESVALAAPEAAVAGVRIEQNPPPALPAVLGDSEAIQRALVNLIHNAIQHSAAGGSVRVSARSGRRGSLEISVEDDGAGISAQELSRIFEPFYRGSGPRNGQFPGTGMGLAIADRIARAHRGRVTAVSAPGHGSSFTLHLPRRRT